MIKSTDHLVARVNIKNFMSIIILKTPKHSTNSHCQSLFWGNTVSLWSTTSIMSPSRGSSWLCQVAVTAGKGMSVDAEMSMIILSPWLWFPCEWSFPQSYGLLSSLLSLYMGNVLPLMHSITFLQSQFQTFEVLVLVSFTFKPNRIIAWTR
jgi:hypothetical protein